MQLNLMSLPIDTFHVFFDLLLLLAITRFAIVCMQQGRQGCENSAQKDCWDNSRSKVLKIFLVVKLEMESQC